VLLTYSSAPISYPAPCGRLFPSKSLVTAERVGALSMAAVAEESRWRSPAAGLTNRLEVAVKRFPLCVAVAPSRRLIGASARLLRASPPVVAAKRNSDSKNPLPTDKKMSQH